MLMRKIKLRQRVPLLLQGICGSKISEECYYHSLYFYINCFIALFMIFVSVVPHCLEFVEAYVSNHLTSLHTDKGSPLAG